MLYFLLKVKCRSGEVRLSEGRLLALLLSGRLDSSPTGGSREQSTRVWRGDTPVRLDSMVSEELEKVSAAVPEMR